MLEPSVLEREVYLPARATWREVATGLEHEGGRNILAAALTTTPTFVRVGHSNSALV